MGFIKNKDKYTFTVYLTPLGKQKFINGGLKSVLKYFSLSDADENYTFFQTDSFNPLNLDVQDIPNLLHENKDIYVQTALRGETINNKGTNKLLLGVNNNIDDYVLYEPTPNSNEFKILTYINIDD
jgi:hypothetical protein